MAKKKTRTTIGVAIGAAIVGGLIAYKNRKKIKSSTNKSVRNVKIKVDNKKFDALRWKDQKIWNFWEKIEDIGNDRKLKSTSIRDIAWG